MADDNIPAKDWKRAAGEIMKPPSSRHFKFQPAILKRTTSGKVLIRGEVHYRSDICRQLIANPLDDTFFRRIVTCFEKWVYTATLTPRKIDPVPANLPTSS